MASRSLFDGVALAAAGMALQPPDLCRRPNFCAGPARPFAKNRARGKRPRVLRFFPPQIGVLVAKQKHDSGRKKMDQRRSKEKREPGGMRGHRAALGKGGRGKR